MDQNEAKFELDRFYREIDIIYQNLQENGFVPPQTLGQGSDSMVQPALFFSAL